MQEDLLSSIKEGPLKEWLKESPRVLSFITKFLKDEKALPFLTRMLGEKEKLTKLLILLVATFFLNYFAKKMIKGFTRNLIRILFFFAIRISGLYYLFHKELDPTLDLIKESFF